MLSVRTGKHIVQQLEHGCLLSPPGAKSRTGSGGAAAVEIPGDVPNGAMAHVHSAHDPAQERGIAVGDTGLGAALWSDMHHVRARPGNPQRNIRRTWRRYHPLSSC
eukprot:1176236-Prorocentrum_minimum.AAC.4